MKWSVLLLSALLIPLAVRALEVGQDAPRFELKNQDDQVWSLSEHLGGKPIAVYFYPAAMTGGCTKQACAYRDYMAGDTPEFMVVGISGDEVEGLGIFQASEKLNFPLLSDPGGSVAKSFGVAVKEGEKSITRTVEDQEVELKRTATTMRWTFVISPEGKIIYKSDQVKPTEDLENVLAFLQSVSQE